MVMYNKVPKNITLKYKIEIKEILKINLHKK